MVTLHATEDLHAALALTARRGRFVRTPWGQRPCSWAYPKGLSRQWLEPELGRLVPRLLNGSQAEVVAPLDWLAEGRDLWRYVPTLPAAVDEYPRWWDQPAAAQPRGWRKDWPYPGYLRGEPLGELVTFVLPLAEDQAARPGRVPDDRQLRAGRWSPTTRWSGERGPGSEPVACVLGRLALGPQPDHIFVEETCVVGLPLPVEALALTQHGPRRVG